MATHYLGRVSIVPKGTYSAGTEYSKLDMVTSAGCSYIYINATPGAGHSLADTDYWMQAAAKGDTGDVTPAAISARDTAIAQAALAQGYAAQLAAGIASPAGTYADLEALNDGTPTAPNTAKIYITLDDGKWCYHNGSAWVAGGVYQATGLADDSITPKHLSKSPYVDNVYLAEDIEPGQIVTAAFWNEPTYDENVSYKHYIFDLSDRLNETIRIKMPTFTATGSIGVSFLSAANLVQANITRSALLTTIGKTEGQAGYIAYIAATSSYYDLNVPVMIATPGYENVSKVVLLLKNDDVAAYYINAQVTYDLADFPWLTNNALIAEEKLDTELATKINNSACPSNVELLIPYHSKLPVLESDLLPAYIDNMLLNYNPQNLVNISSQNVYIKIFDKRIIALDGTQGSGDLSGAIRLHFNDTLACEYYKTLFYTIVADAAGTGATKKVIFIGDSITENLMYLSELVDLFAADVMDIELIGTRGTTIKHEGRSGWAAYNYVHDASALTFDNAFWNAGTSAFDFSYYMTENEFAGVDYVFICLGTNDPIRGTTGMTNDEKEDLIIASYTTMINSILTYNASTKIVLWLPPTRSLIGSATRTSVDSALLVNKWLMAAFDTTAWKNSGVHLLPVHYAVNPYADYDSDEIVIGGETMSENAASIHPIQSGADKIAKYIFNMIKWLATT